MQTHENKELDGVSAENSKLFTPRRCLTRPMYPPNVLTLPTFLRVLIDPNQSCSLQSRVCWIIDWIKPINMHSRQSTSSSSGPSPSSTSSAAGINAADMEDARWCHPTTGAPRGSTLSSRRIQQVHHRRRRSCCLPPARHFLRELYLLLFNTIIQGRAAQGVRGGHSPEAFYRRGQGHA